MHSVGRLGMVVSTRDRFKQDLSKRRESAFADAGREKDSAPFRAARVRMLGGNVRAQEPPQRSTQASPAQAATLTRRVTRRSTSVRVMMDTGAPVSSTTYTRWRCLPTSRVSTCAHQEGGGDGENQARITCNTHDRCVAC